MKCSIKDCPSIATHDGRCSRHKRRPRRADILAERKYREIVRNRRQEAELIARAIAQKELTRAMMEGL